jgi:hypothetical protein
MLSLDDLPKLKITQLPRTGKPYKLDRLPPEIEYTINGMVYNLKVIYQKVGILEAHRFICEECYKPCTTLYFHDKALCPACVKKIARKRSRPEKVDDLYRKLQELIDHSKVQEFQGHRKQNKRIKALSNRIARLEGQTYSKL